MPAVTTNGALGSLMVKRKSLLRYAFSTGSMAVGLLAHAIGFVLLARSLGSIEFGRLILITSASSLGAVWCEFGVGEMVRRRLANEPEIYDAVLGHAMAVIATMGVAVTATLATVILTMLEGAGAHQLRSVVLLVFSNVVLFVWINIVEQLLLAKRELWRANLLNAGFGIGRSVFAAVACLGFGVDSLNAWAAWHASFYLFVAAAGSLAIIRLGRPSLSIMRGELWLGSTMSASAFLIVLRQNIDLLAVSAVAPPAVVANYGIARRGIGTASVVGSSLDRIAYSNFVAAARQGPGATWRFAAKYAVYAAILMGGAALSLFVLAPYVPLLFGSQYAQAESILRILCWVMILNGIQNIAIDALNSAEQHHRRLKASSLATMAGSALIVALTLSTGLPGTFLGVYLTDVLIAAMLWYTLRKWVSQRTAEHPQSRV